MQNERFSQRCAMNARGLGRFSRFNANPVKRMRIRAAVSALFFLFTCVVASGCFSMDSDQKSFCLIRVGSTVVTAEDFKKAFEASLSSYPADVVHQRQYVIDIRHRVLNQLSEEAVIRERASELGIDIREAQVRQAADEIKKDYPDDEFEDMLLTSAVSYKAWSQRLRRRILIDKVIKTDLEDKIQISSEAISADYLQYCESQGLEPDAASDESEEIRAKIALRLRREEAEKRYTRWLNKLRIKYGIEVNKALWEKLVNS